MFRRHIVMSTNLWHGRRPLQEDMEYTCMRCAKPRIDGDSIIVCGNKTVAAVNFIQSCDYMDCIRSSTACKQCPSEYSFNRYAVIMSLLDTTRRPCYMYDLPIIVWITSVRCVCRSDYGVGWWLSRLPPPPPPSWIVKYFTREEVKKGTFLVRNTDRHFWAVKLNWEEVKMMSS